MNKKNINIKFVSPSSKLLGLRSLLSIGLMLSYGVSIAASTSCTDKVPDFTNSVPPGDYSGTLPATDTALAVFAWQHFIALNWSSSYSTNQQRGVADTTKTFYETPTLAVWQSYRHKNELFRPHNAAPDSNFNTAPTYVYKNITGACSTADTDPNNFTNLDENSQLGLDYMFAQPTGATAPIEFLFEAKVNEDNYNYIVTNQLYTKTNEATYAAINTADLATYGAICQQSQPTLCAQNVAGVATAGYCLPCGDTTGTEGTIHVKAAWRKLLSTEDSSKYLTSSRVFYKESPADSGNVCYTNAVTETWALAGLHIIHKTENFPAFFFASWEHVDNVGTNLKFKNTVTGGPTDTVGVLQDWNRATFSGTSLPSTEVQSVNGCVQDAIKTASSSSIWQNYQLVGIQGTPVDYASNTSDLPDFFLANNVIESNAFFQNFLGSNGGYSATGTGPAGTTPGTNLTYHKTNYDMGGCQGCHGNAQQKGTDMSFLVAGGANKAEAIDEFENISPRVQSYRLMTTPTVKSP